IIKEEISKYLELNNNNILNIKEHINPKIYIDKDNFILRNELIEIFNITDSHPIKELNGQKGLRIKKDKFISKYKCLGIFCGYTMTELEFEQIYYGSYLWDIINCYAFDAEYEWKSKKYNIVI